MYVMCLLEGHALLSLSLQVFGSFSPVAEAGEDTVELGLATRVTIATLLHDWWVGQGQNIE